MDRSRGSAVEELVGGRGHEFHIFLLLGLLLQQIGVFPMLQLREAGVVRFVAGVNAMADVGIGEDVVDFAVMLEILDFKRLNSAQAFAAGGGVGGSGVKAGLGENRIEAFGAMRG